MGTLMDVLCRLNCLENSGCAEFCVYTYVYSAVLWFFAEICSVQTSCIMADVNVEEEDRMKVSIGVMELFLCAGSTVVVLKMLCNC
jgi:hypothetical protein